MSTNFSRRRLKTFVALIAAPIFVTVLGGLIIEWIKPGETKNASNMSYDPASEMLLTENKTANLFDGNLFISVELLGANWDTGGYNLHFTVGGKGQHPIRRVFAKVGDTVRCNNYEVRVSSTGKKRFWSEPAAGFMVTKLP